MDKIKDIFPRGEINPFSKYFVGESRLNMLTTSGVAVGNVTFAPRCRNHWHIHHGGGQILLCTGGKGWYCEENKPPRTLKAGDVVKIPAEVKHWHGAAKDSEFSHLAIEIPAQNGRTEWCESVTDEEYDKLD